LVSGSPVNGAVPAATDGDTLPGAELGGELRDAEPDEVRGADDVGLTLDRAFVQAAHASSEMMTTPRAITRRDPCGRSSRA
jgi:hypothetical protein